MRSAICKNAPSRARSTGGQAAAPAAGAFSLVELLVALSIILVMAATIAGIYTPIVNDSAGQVLQANLTTIRRAIHEFYNDHGRYPYEGQDDFGNVVAFLDNNTSELVQGVHAAHGAYPGDPDPVHSGQKLPGRRTRYLLNMPQDPTIEDAATKAAGWKLIYAGASELGLGAAGVRQVKNVQSLNADYANY